MSKYFYGGDGSQELGKQAELRFENLIKQRKLRFQKATSTQDRIEHWDYRVWFNGGFQPQDATRVEVKSMKRAKRSDEQVSSELVYVEFKNVAGNLGWVYGKADKVALEQPDGFILVNRVDLAKLAEDLVHQEFSSVPQLYKLYCRKNRPEELVTVISIADVYNTIGWELI